MLQRKNIQLLLGEEEGGGGEVAYRPVLQEGSLIAECSKANNHDIASYLLKISAIIFVFPYYVGRSHFTRYMLKIASGSYLDTLILQICGE